MSDNDNGGPWGGGNNQENGGKTPWGDQGGKRPNGQQGGPIPPDLEELLNKGREQFKVLMGGKGGGTGKSGGGSGASFGKGSIGLVVIGALILWLMASFYRVDTSEESVELFLGKRYKVGQEGLNFAPWPLVTKVILPVTRENIEEIGTGRGSPSDKGLMLTGDENIVDIDFQVVWNISNPEEFLFNIAEPRETIRAVSESVMREIVARTDLTPILTTGKGVIENELSTLVQNILDSYKSGVNIVRVNLDAADPPAEVAESFRSVQAAKQTRVTLEQKADAYANTKMAGARGKAAQMLEQAAGYRAEVVNGAEGEAARFLSVLEEYSKAKDVTRKRLYLETIEKVYSDVNKVIIDGSASGQGVVPYLPLNQLTPQNNQNTQGSTK